MVKRKARRKIIRAQKSTCTYKQLEANRRFIHADLALKMIINCRTDESCDLKSNLGFTIHDVINPK